MSTDVRLRDVHPDVDLPVFFEHQRDAASTRMADVPSRDRAAFDAHWARNVLGNPTAVTRTVLLDGAVAGYVGSWEQDGVRLVGYWIGRAYWGRGVATAALALFLTVVTVRPLHAHVARRNAASVRVLEKCGFRREEAGGAESPEVVLVLG